MKVLIAITVCLSAASALLIGGDGVNPFECPDVDVIEDFKIKKFSGIWYQQAYSLGSEMSQGYSTCGIANWTETDSTTMHMINRQKGLLGNWQKVEGDAVLENPSEGNFTTTFKTFWGTHTFQLKVLATDYDSFAITYSCAKVFGFPIPLEAAWITTRLQTAEGTEFQELEKKIKAAIDGIYGLNYSDFKKTKQINCD